MSVSKETLDEIALTEDEYKQITLRLGREPNGVELGMFGALWSEHCGYKHSKLLLRELPSDSPRLLVMPGVENAGVVDIGDGMAVVMKIESHNHPSAVEPFQGAATGVGGIIRDIFAMGARPVALLNSLRFGPLTDRHNQHLFGGVVSGISWYGNCIGIPDVGGEVCFSSTYSGNPLVNAMCVGLVQDGNMVKAIASGKGNLLLLVGADTGRDGIHGASGLASRTFEEEREMRPTVQVGNPFMEKILVEACLEVAAGGYLIGMQDLGAAGMTSSIVEAAAKGSSGVSVDVSKVRRREQGMTAYEIMLSESQERMLVVIEPRNLSNVRAIFGKWDIESEVIGEVTDGRRVDIFDGEKLEASLPIDVLTEPPLYRPISEPPDYLNDTSVLDLDKLSVPNENPGHILLRVLASPNIASKEWIYRQYDHQVQTNTIQGPGGDASVIRIKNTSKAIAITTDGNGRYSYLDPMVGASIAVAEACRNLSCVGAEPLALTDCLNFGNPERPEVFYQLENCVKGMKLACEELNVPVISGNVSLYNETRGEAIWPTPIIGAMGLIEGQANHVTMSFKDEGDVIILMGTDSLVGDPSALAGTEFLELIHGTVAGLLFIDLDLERRVQALCRDAINAGMVKSAHDVSDGGIAVALAESCVAGGIGVRSNCEINGRWDAALFGEIQSRIIISLSRDYVEQFMDMAKLLDVPCLEIGVVGGNAISWENLMQVTVEQMESTWRNGLQEMLR